MLLADSMQRQDALTPASMSIPTLDNRFAIKLTLSLEQRQ